MMANKIVIPITNLHLTLGGNNAELVRSLQVKNEELIKERAQARLERDSIELTAQKLADACFDIHRLVVRCEASLAKLPAVPGIVNELVMETLGCIIDSISGAGIDLAATGAQEQSDDSEETGEDLFEKQIREAVGGSNG